MHFIATFAQQLILATEEGEEVVEGAKELVPGIVDLRCAVLVA